MKNEFAQLCDLAIAQGISHSDLIHKVHQEVLAEFRKKYPQSPVGIAVLVDESTGLVRIFSGSDDITPNEFSEELNSIARQTILGELSGVPQRREKSTSGSTPTTSIFQKRFSPTGIFGKLIFWGYNLYFLLFNFALLLSVLFPSKPGNFFETLKTYGFTRLVISLAIFCLPILTMIFALQKRLYRQTVDLMQLFFLLEVPFAVLLFVTLSVIGQTSTFIALMLITFLFSPFLLYLHVSKIEIAANFLKILLPLNHLTAIMSGYLTLLYSFIVPLILFGSAQGIFRDIFRFDNYGQSADYATNYPGKFLSFGFGLLLFSLVAGLTLIPYLITSLLWKITAGNYQSLVLTAGKERADKYSQISWLIVFFIITVSLFRWPDNRLIAQLENFPREGDYQTQEKAALSLIDHEKKLQELIVQKINYKKYYPFSKTDSYLEYNYYEVFGSKSFGKAVQSGFSYLAYPLVYWGTAENNRNLTDNFIYLYGYPYYQKTIVPVPTPKNVLMTYRQTKIVPENNGVFASVTIEEEYENQTYQQQEVIYEFNLPPETVITDLKLGPSLEFPGIVAPKGAAQRTYERELQKRRDPALLEQTGPNQYRLRIFPIPAKNDLTTLKGKRQKVSFSYTVGWDNGYALPIYTKKTNVYSDGSSLINVQKDGKLISAKDNEIKVETPDSSRINLCNPQSTPLSLQANNTKAEILFHANNPRLKVITCGQPDGWLPEMQKYRTAIIYDTSYANKQNNLLPELKKLIKNSRSDFLDSAVIDLYKFNDKISQKERLTNGNIDQLLNPIHFAKVPNFSSFAQIEDKYDLAILISGKDVSFAQLTNFPFSAPTKVYWVGDGPLPPFNLETTSGIWQSGGGVTTTIEEALRTFLVKETVKQIADNTVPLSKYWSIQYNNLPESLPDSMFSETSSLAKEINKGLLLHFVTNQSREVVSDVTVMDQLNLAAKKVGIASPYSSLIALVNEQQLDRLDSESDQYNRYQDQVITENLNNPPTFRTDDIMLMPQSSGGGFFSSSPSILNLEMGAPSYGGGTYSGNNFQPLSSLSGGGSIFILFSILVFGVGFVVFLLRSLKKK